MDNVNNGNLSDLIKNTSDKIVPVSNSDRKILSEKLVNYGEFINPPSNIQN